MISNYSNWFSIFGRVRPAVIAMIHLKALPGTPNSNMPIDSIVEDACQQAYVYSRAQVDAVLVENMHDVPYNAPSDIGPEIVASMTRVCCEIRRVLPHLPCGVQVLAGGNVEALAIAKATGMNFIRAEGFVFGHVADEGLMNACAGPLLRYRRAIDGRDVLVLTDVKKKHSSHSITNDTSVSETAKAAEFFLSDGVIVTGASTGGVTCRRDVDDVLKAVRIPVLVGSGVNLDNVASYAQCHGIIVGSHFKRNDRWQNEIVFDKVETFMETVKDLRSKASSFS